MKNIPVFLGGTGTATLILSQIPHRKTAYILLRTVEPGGISSLLAECTGFCRGCGAEECFASAEDPSLLSAYPHAYDLYLLHRPLAGLPEPERTPDLRPMTPENDPVYQRLYNRCFAEVSHAMTYDRTQIQRIYRMDQQAFLALEPDGTPWAMGELHGSELAAVGILPEFRGMGRSRDLTLALLNRCPGPELTLTVVSDNEPALRLYDGLGFTVAGTAERWYRI